MFRNLVCLLLALNAFASGTPPAGTTPLQETCPGPHWVGAYVPGWAQEDSTQFQDREFKSISYLLHFAVFFRSNGSLDLNTNELTPNKMRDIVAQGHRSDRKVLLVVGGERADEGLRVACRPKNLAHTVHILANLVEMYGYDGIDMDWEPFPTGDPQLYAETIKSLRRSLDEISTRRDRARLILSAAIQVDINDEPYMRSLRQNLVELRGFLDQINLMTYTMANPMKLPFVWHNSALYPAGKSPKPGFRTPNTDEAVRAFLVAGFQAGQLGIGINLHGYLWRSRDNSSDEDLSQPGRIWKGRPKVSELTYDEVMSEYFNPSRYRWDNDAQVPYLSIPETQTFISYENAQSIQEKLAYARSHQLGGMIIWDTGGTREPNGNRRLLEAVDDAIRRCAPGTSDQQH